MFVRVKVGLVSGGIAEVHTLPDGRREEAYIPGTGYAYEPGDLVEWEDEDEARRLVKARVLEPIPDLADAKELSRTVGKVIQKQERHGKRAPEAAMRPAAVAR